MDRETEIKLKFLSITESYKSEFSRRLKKSNSIKDSLSKYPLLTELKKKLQNELLSVGNKYFDKNNISDKKELDELINVYSLDFYNYALNF